MAFDPNVIGQIGAGPSEALGQGITRGFQLKDLINQTTLGNMEVQQKKKAQEQSEFLSKVSKEFDVTNPEQASKAASKASQAGYPDLATGIMKQSQSLQLGQAQINEARFQAGMQAQTYIDDGVQRILAGVNAQTSAKNADGTERYDQRTKDALTLGAVLKFKKDLEDDNTMSPEARKMAMAEVNKYLAGGQPITYDGINTIARSTKVGREAFDKEIDRRNKLSEIENRQDTLEERKRHDLATEQVATKKAAESSGGFEGKPGELMAALAERGVSLPAGFRSKAQQTAMLQQLVARHPDQNVDQIADDIKSGRLKLAAETKGAQTAGTQIGKVSLTANELDTFGDQTIQASDAIPRGSFVPWNKLRNWGRDKVSDPQLLYFQSKMQALENAYEQLSARSGTDMEKRKYIRRLFDEARSPEAVRTLVQALKEEAAGARGAAAATIAEASGKSVPGTAVTAEKGPSRISSDADYNALPSGATFIAPDGTTRRKP